MGISRGRFGFSAFVAALFLCFGISSAFALVSPICRVPGKPAPAELRKLVKMTGGFEAAEDWAVRSRNGNLVDRFTALAEYYSESNRIQESVWTLRRAGRMRAAKIQLACFENYIRSQPLTGERRRLKRKGITDSYKLDLGNGVWGVVKPVGAVNEVFAYELNEELELDLVPLTIGLRAGNGRIRWSLQVFIEDGHFESHARDFRNSNYSVQFLRFYWLDYLLTNTDRHGDNWFYRPGRNLVAIDHGYTNGYEEGVELEIKHPLLPLGEMLDRFERLDVEKFRNLLSRKKFSFFRTNYTAFMKASRKRAAAVCNRRLVP